MTAPEIIMWLTVLGVGIPSAWRNPTSAALVLAWFAGQAFYLATGNNLPVEYYPFTDIFAIAIIFSKPEACNFAPYRSIWHQLSCLVIERSRADRVVMLIFPAMWIAYAADMHPYYRWHLLWALCLAQFLAAGAEALLSHRRHAEAADQPDPPGLKLVALRGRGYG